MPVTPHMWRSRDSRDEADEAQALHIGPQSADVAALKLQQVLRWRLVGGGRVWGQQGTGTGVKWKARGGRQNQQWHLLSMRG